MLKDENYTKHLVVGLALTLVILFGFSFYLITENSRMEAAAATFEEERVHHGRTIYTEQCASCHGAQGEGGVGTALNNKTLLKNTFDDVFFSVVRSGVPSTEMPAWSVDFGGPLTDEDIRSVVAFIRAWEPTAPEIAPVVFTPSAEQGALIFDTNCSACHGTDGIDSAMLAKLNDDWLRQLVTYGLPAKGMPAYGQAMTADQIEHLMALFGAWRAGEQVDPAYNATDLISAAIFALESNDVDSAVFHVSRAQAIIPAGPAADALTAASENLTAGDAVGALPSLEFLRDNWPIGDPEPGAETYAASCAVCHGAEGEGGGGGVFPVLNPNEFVQANNNAAMVEFITQGRAGTAMAGFDGRLTEAEIANVVAFLRLWQP